MRSGARAEGIKGGVVGYQRGGVGGGETYNL